MSYRSQVLPIAAGGTNAATASGARTQLGLGTAAVLDVGTGANQVVQLNASSQLPAVDGSLLTNLGASALGVYKQPVRVATNAALPAYTRVGNVISANITADINTAGVDSVTTLVNGDRVLLKDGAAGADNGLYTITDIGSIVTVFVLTRSTDADTSAEVVNGAFVHVNEGTVNANKDFVLTTANPITLNTTALTFALTPVAIATSQITDDAVTTAKIVSAAVTPAKVDLTQAFAFTGLLTAAGGLKVARTATATDYTVLTTDVLVGVTSTAAARVIDLPPAATATAGRLYIIKDESLAAGTNSITINPDGAELIEGVATYVINTNGGSVAVYTDATNWFVW